MKAISLNSAEEFLAATFSLRSKDPVLTNLLGSIATGVVAGRTYDGYHWWIVEEDGHVIGAAARTLPHHLVLSPMSQEALATLATLICEQDPEFPGVAGTREVVNQAARAFNAPFVEKMAMLIYVLDQLQPPAVSGGARASQPSDTDLLLEWHQAFADEAGIITTRETEQLAAAIADGWFTLWEDHDVVVAFAGNAQLVSTEQHRIGRVGPVYTPPANRRKGYGAAVTAAVSKRLIDQGCNVVMLYTDAANPTSNSIYQQIGYQLVSEWAELDRKS